jgi:peptidoglycan/xylan/chitin deacetylase (PgdA/CDA1 family)
VDKYQMNLTSIWHRIKSKFERTAGALFYRRALVMQNPIPYISFTFDDFPRSALHSGGSILVQYEIRATYYASLGLMGTYAPTGEIFTLDDLKKLFDQGHELGSHTFNHSNAWKTSVNAFEDSIIKNNCVLNELVPGVSFTSFSYPITVPRIGSKQIASRYYSCSRGGGQKFNVGETDLNLLKAFFLEKSRDNFLSIKKVIDQNQLAKGWLIFATHDISDNPTNYGCTPHFFEEIVKYSKESGARILPVARALDEIREYSLADKK